MLMQTTLRPTLRNFPCRLGVLSQGQRQTGAAGATSSPRERSKAIPAPVCSLAVQASGQLDGPRSWAGEFGI